MTKAVVVMVIVTTESGVADKISEMYMNRPFVLYICERKYGIILFAAVIGNHLNNNTSSPNEL